MDLAWNIFNCNNKSYCLTLMSNTIAPKSLQKARRKWQLVYIFSQGKPAPRCIWFQPMNNPDLPMRIKMGYIIPANLGQEEFAFKCAGFSGRSGVCFLPKKIPWSPLASLCKDKPQKERLLYFQKTTQENGLDTMMRMESKISREHIWN